MNFAVSVTAASDALALQATQDISTSMNELLSEQTTEIVQHQFRRNGLELFAHLNVSHLEAHAEIQALTIVSPNGTILPEAEAHNLGIMLPIVGAVVGAALVAGLIGFVCYEKSRKREEEDEELLSSSEEEHEYQGMRAKQAASPSPMIIVLHESHDE